MSPDERRVRSQVAAWLGWASGVGVVVLMAAGADWPPPPGFVVIVAYAVLVVVGVRRLLPGVLERWSTAGAAAALRRAVLWGLAGGSALAALTIVGGFGEPSVDVGLLDRVLFVCVVGAVGAAAAVAIAALGRALMLILARPGG